jgi:hypothetical protein
MIGPGGLLLVVPHLFAVIVSISWLGFARKKITKLGCEKYFCWGLILSTSGDAFSKSSSPIFALAKVVRWVTLHEHTLVLLASILCPMLFAVSLGPQWQRTEVGIEILGMHPGVSGCVFFGEWGYCILKFFLLFPMGSHQVPNMFPKFSMCSQ